FELVSGYRLQRRHWIAVGALLGVSLLANVVALRNGAALLRYHGTVDRATLAALELQAPRVERSRTLRSTLIYQLAGISDPTKSDLIYMTPSEYFDAADKFGSAAYPPAEIAMASEYARESADRLLLQVLAVKAEAVPAGTTVGSGAGCTTLGPTAADSPPPSIEIPAGGLIVRASRADAQLGIRRFAEVSTIVPFAVPPRSARALSIPGDRLPQPWRADIRSSTPVTACPAARSRPARKTR
ncbi:MAG: hypothetical protein WBM00_04280, partial [Solirubrobacterales bacterium]